MRENKIAIINERLQTLKDTDVSNMNYFNSFFI